MKNKHLPLKIGHRNQIAAQVNKIKVLDITLDGHLTWKGHISEIYMDINRFVFALKEVNCDHSVPCIY